MERVFRISKGTLEMYPMFHFTERRIEAHVCTCFIVCKIYKELERLVGFNKIAMSVDHVLDAAKTITTIRIKMPDIQILTKIGNVLNIDRWFVSGGF